MQRWDPPAGWEPPPPVSGFFTGLGVCLLVTAVTLVPVVLGLWGGGFL